MTPFLKGIAMGFCIAAPVGPIGLLCIRRAIQNGRLAGFVSGLGAATADALYGLAAALGLTAIMEFLLGYRTWIRGLGGLFLVYLGLSIIRNRKKAFTERTGTTTTLVRAYGSTFVLTLTNPATLLFFIGLFAGLGFGATTGSPGPAAFLVSGVFLGSATWWLLLSLGANWIGERVDAGRLSFVNLAAGLAIVAFGAIQLTALFTVGP